MQLVVVGAHQRTAPVAIRERLAFSEAEAGAALRALHAAQIEGVILSTCNRVEVYAFGAPVDQGRALRQFVATWHDLDLNELTPHLYTWTGEDAVRHLFRTAAGLDSMALGEDQIMSQLKAALALARAAGTVGTVLHRLMMSALAAGKLVRSQTALARAQLSVVSVALQLARQTLGDLAAQRVLIVGAGRTAELALKHLKTEKLAALHLASRTVERAHELGERYQARVWPLDDLEQALHQSDVVLSCTSAPDVVLEYAQVARVMQQRTTPLLLLDLAVPRDIDRQVATLPGIKLVDVDDLQAICETNRASRAAEVSAAETLVDGEVRKWMEWWATQEVLPTIRALREHAEAIRTAELERTLARLPDLSAEQQAVVAAMTNAIVNKLLHHPITTLKTPEANSQLAQATQQLFRLTE